MPEVDSLLAQSLRQAKSSPMYFAFVAKGSADGALVVSKKAISPAEIKEAKDKSGGTAVFRGRCFGEDGTTIFELAQEPPGTLAQQLRKIITRDAGLSLKVETRVGAVEGAEHEGEETPPSAPPPSGAPDMTAFRGRLKEVSPLYQEASKKAPPRKAELDKVATQAAGAAKAGDFVNGLSLLGNLETLSREILAGAPVAPPPPPGADMAGFKTRLKEVSPFYQEAAKKAPDRKADLDKVATQAAGAAKAGDIAAGLAHLERLEVLSKQLLQTAPPAPPPPNDAAAAFKARLKEVSPQYQDAAKKAPDQKAALDALAAKAAGAAKAGDFARAMGLLDELSTAVQAALRPPEPVPEAPPAVDGAAFKARMKEVLPIYLQAAQKAPDRKAELDALAAQAATAGKNKNFAGAIDLLDQLEARSKGALRAGEAAEEIAKAGGSKVKYVKHAMKYRQARDRSKQELAKLQTAILKDKATQADERYAQIQPAVEKLDRLLAGLDDRLVIGLRAIDDAKTPEDGQKARRDASTILQEYRKSVDGDALLKLMDNETGYGKFDIYASLSKSLRKLTDTLKA